MSTDTETSCERFLISLGQYQQEFHSMPCTKPYANIALYQANANFGMLPQRPFFKIGDVIRTWQISQSYVTVSHENLDVEYYHFDYELCIRIQLGNFLVVSS